MTTKPMKALVALASVALLGSLIAGVNSPAFASGCGLTVGEGTEVNPWRVSSEADFQKVGTTACTLVSPAVTYYRQSESFEINTSKALVQVSETFAGVYDGDHHTLELTGDRSPFSRISGTVKKLRLTGSLVATYSGFSEQALGSLVAQLDGGVISEVGSTANIDASSLRATIGSPAAPEIWLGGLVGLSERDSAVGLIQYSFYSGNIKVFLEGSDYGGGAKVGGLVGRGDDSLWIRDSYSLARVEYVKTESVSVGGIVGYFLGDSLNLVRTYAAGSFTVKAECKNNCAFKYFGEGGLVGEANDMAKVRFVSTFWLSPTPAVAVGRLVKLGDSQPLRYSTTPLSAPVAVGVNAQTLRTISTFQSKGDNNGPFGTNSLPIGNSTPGATPSDNDYRWAIESGNVETFVAQRRVDADNDNAGALRVVGETLTFTRAFDRLLWTNSDVPTATYTTKGVPETVGGYPALGRVWEICSNRDVNDGFPVLVWEEYDCPSEGTGGGGTDRKREKPADPELAAALAAGLSGAELQAFLASGLTLEQWLAQRLAATGTPSEALGLGVAIAGLLTMVGVILVFLRRRTNAGPV